MNSAFTDGAGELSRRRLIRNTGLSALAIGGLSACTNYGAQPAAPATSAWFAPRTRRAEPGAPPSPRPTFRWAVARSSRSAGGGHQPASGEFKAFTSVCTHQGCTVAEVVQTINCTCHGSKFSITDGSVVNGPATAPLAAKNVTANGDNLTVS